LVQRSYRHSQSNHQNSRTNDQNNYKNQSENKIQNIQHHLKDNNNKEWIHDIQINVNNDYDFPYKRKTGILDKSIKQIHRTLRSRWRSRRRKINNPVKILMSRWRTRRSRLNRFKIKILETKMFKIHKTCIRNHQLININPIQDNQDKVYEEVKGFGNELNSDDETQLHMSRGTRTRSSRSY
jgi:hypothetical protein